MLPLSDSQAVVDLNDLISSKEAEGVICLCLSSEAGRLSEGGLPAAAQEEIKLKVGEEETVSGVGVSMTYYTSFPPPPSSLLPPRSSLLGTVCHNLCLAHIHTCNTTCNTCNTCNGTHLPVSSLTCIDPRMLVSLCVDGSAAVAGSVWLLRGRG